MSQKESTIQKRIVDYLNSLPYCKAVINHGNAWQGSGRPDIFASYRELFLALEVKTETGQLTKLQLHELNKWSETGAIIGVVRNVDDVRQLLSLPPVKQVH